jgi:hypothetical protein
VVVEVKQRSKFNLEVLILSLISQDSNSIIWRRDKG